MKKVILVVILSIILLLSLGTVYMMYAQIFEAPAPTAAATEPASYRVSFKINDTLIEEQTVTENQLPAVVTGQIPGVQLLRWEDAQGHPTDPFAQPVTGDTTYQAVFYPQLDGTGVYLFVDEAGLLQPDEPLTHEDVTLALNTLAAEGAAEYFPQLSLENISMTLPELKALLAYFYTDEAIGEAFADAQEATRAVFAAGMNDLLGRDTNAPVVLAEGYTIPADVTAGRADTADLLAACLAHTPAEEGITWNSLELPTPYEPGFINLEGQLYYVQEDHYFLRDGNVGTLYFDAEGRYTSGDATLDATVVSILQTLIAENPDADRFTLLRAVFEHCYENYTYRRTFDHPAYGSTGWEIQRANAMFETTKGNCYSYAAIFWALSRALGYETRAISGKVLKDEQPHSWCIIQLEEDGQDYIFDPQWQYNYIERGLDHDMFKISMDRIGYWLYQWTE